jgi:SAM-dependent methyltransferase
LQWKRLLRDASLTKDQLEMLETVNRQIHHRDGMYAGKAEDYFAVGLSAVECVDEVLRHTPKTTVREVLDLPSGYGRELRFFIQRFPNATFTACDIQPGAVKFCAKAFGALPVDSKANISELSFDCEFDLIWCGSLLTHLDEPSTRSLLKVFSDHLTPSGVMIVTTHGDYVAEQMRSGATYELPAGATKQMAAIYDERGHAYHDYAQGLGYFDFHPAESGYGVSLMSPSWFRSLAADLKLNEVYFAARGWANHQDVFALGRSG